MKKKIYQRKDGRFEARVSLGKNSEGKYQYKSVYGRTYMDCLQKLAVLFPEEDKTSRNFSITYKEVCEMWIYSINACRKQSTLSRYHYVLQKHLIPAFGNYLIIDINDNIINDFIRELSNKKIGKDKTLSSSSVRNITIVLKTTLAFAEKKFNLNILSKGIQLTKVKRTQQIISDDNWKLLRKRLKDDFSKTSVAISLAVHMGMRIGEICALKRKDIDLENKLIYVQRTVQRIYNHKGKSKTYLSLGEPKSFSSRRVIPIPDILFDKIAYFSIGTKAEDFILGVTYNRALDPRTLQYRFYKFLKKNNIDIINFHQLRHKFAGSYIERRFDVKSLSEILGHSNVSITLNYYVHPTIAFKRRQINLLAKD